MGIKILSQYEVIDEREWGHLTTTSELSYEEHDGIKYARFRFTTFKGSGTAGRERKSFAWPVSSIERPVELKQIMEQIIKASLSDATFNDHRGGFGRFFDNLFGVRLINSLEDIASHHHFNKRHWLSVTIYRENKGIVVTLCHYVKKGQQIWIRLPFETIEAIHAWADK